MNKKIKSTKITICIVALTAALGLSLSPKAQAGTPHNNSYTPRHGMQISINAGHRSTARSNEHGYDYRPAGHASSGYSYNKHRYNKRRSNGHGYKNKRGHKYNGRNSNSHSNKRSH